MNAMQVIQLGGNFLEHLSLLSILSMFGLGSFYTGIKEFVTIKKGEFVRKRSFDFDGSKLDEFYDMDSSMKS